MVSLVALVLSIFVASVVQAESISGFYMESRTCQVYTGPCFANAEFGLTGNDAIMAWHIEEGSQANVNVAGLSVVVVVHTNETLASAGIEGVKEVKSVVFVDERADALQRVALVDFAKSQIGKAAKSIARVESSPITMSLERGTLEGRLDAGKFVKMVTRRARPGDCICSNEVAYYPPLASLTNFAPGVATEAQFAGRGLGTQWSFPESRSSYMGLFAF
jgi:hypothetical protein